MKRILLAIIVLVAMSTTVLANDFTYKGIVYTVVDEMLGTCQTRSGYVETDIFNQKTYYPGNYIEGTLVIPEKVYSGEKIYKVVGIGDYSFINNQISDLSIPYIKSIGKMAFYNCPLGSIIIDDNFDQIGHLAFGGLGTYRIATPEKYEASFKAPLTDHPATTFVYDPSATHVFDRMLISNDDKQLIFAESHINWDLTIPDGITTIQDEAFLNCNNIKVVKFPKSLSSIGVNAFKECSSLVSIMLPEATIKIGKGAFQECRSLTDVTLPHNLETIEESCFSDCPILETLNINENLKNIEQCAFINCTSLKSIELPYNLHEIGSEAFKNCNKLEKVVFSNQDIVSYPSAMTSIGIMAFEGCNALSEVILPASLNKLDISTFSACHSLKNITIPDAVKEIDAGCFSQSGLETIFIPQNVERIKYSAFSHCENLKYVYFNSGELMLSDEIFADCNNIKSVYYNSDKLTEASDTLFSLDAYTTATLFVPEDALESVANTSPWNLFRKVESHDFSDVDFVTSPEQKVVYSLDGKRLNISLDALPRGIYIIKGGTSALKLKR